MFPDEGGNENPKDSGVEGEGGRKETTELRYSQELDNRTALCFRRGQKRNPLKSDLHKKIKAEEVLQMLGQDFQFT